LGTVTWILARAKHIRARSPIRAKAGVGAQHAAPQVRKMLAVVGVSVQQSYFDL
jgi:hypothetical protein